MMSRVFFTAWIPLLLSCLAACGGAQSLSGGGIRDISAPGTSLTPSTGTGPEAAAAPTQEGILSAPADDDTIVSGTADDDKKLMHFDVFLAPEYKIRLAKGKAHLGAEKLTLLAQVGEILKDGCEDPDMLSCWNWLDPNLLKGLVVRARVATVAKIPSIEDPNVFLFQSKWYYQDFKIGELNPQGFNLSLLDLKPLDGDEVWLTMYNQVPEDYSPARSPLFDGYPSEYSGKGRHFLGMIKIGEIFLYKPGNP